MIQTATSTLTEAEFIAVCRLSKSGLARALRGMTVLQALEFRRNVQIALTRFSKGKPVLSVTEGAPVRIGDPSELQFRALAVCKVIERWSREVYMRDKTLDLIRWNTELAKNPKAVKNMLKEKWERFIKTRSY
jgi:hypothetical protein